MNDAIDKTDSTQAPLIAHIIYALGTGGLENGLINIINRCPPERYRHAIICLTSAGDFAQRISAADVEIIELHKKPGHDLAMYWRLWRQLRRLHPAIVHTRNLAALETQLLGLFLPRIRRVHGEHGRDINDLDGSNRKYRLLRRALLPVIDRFIAVSRDLAYWLIDSVGIPPERVTQIYNGVNQDRFTPRPTSAEQALDSGAAKPATRRTQPTGMPPDFLPETGGQLLGTVGRLAAVKDQQSLLTALHQVLGKQPERRETLRLMIVGEGPERQALETRIEALDLGDCVWLAGDREDIPELLRIMDVFLLPSLGEGISNTVLEAMATGLPVIATDTGGNPELVRHGKTGLLTGVGDTSGLARAIEVLLDDPDRRQRMGQAARQRIHRDFNWERTLADYLHIYDELLQRREHHAHPAGR